MAYRLDLGRPVPAELRRCADDQLRAAIAQLEAADDDRVEAVRQARKNIKKARAVLRLARPAMSAAAYRSANVALRDAARELADVRDADMLGPALDALAARYPDRLPKTTFATAREAVAPRGADRTHALAAPAAVERGRAALEAIVAQVPSWPLERCDEATVVTGLVDGYAEGRRRWRAAAHDPDAEALHEWRKRVKDLWYHERLLRDLWPELLAVQIAEAKRLADLLGEDHDLAVLRDALAPHTTELHPLIDERRREVHAAAVVSARRVYVDRPRAVARRLRRLARAPRGRLG